MDGLGGFLGEDNDDGLGYRKYTPWTLPRTRKDIFWKRSGELVWSGSRRRGEVWKEGTLLVILVIDGDCGSFGRVDGKWDMKRDGVGPFLNGEI